MVEEIKASAEAAKAVAETTGKAIDATDKLGSFLGRIFGPALEEYGGMLHDSVRFKRGVNLLRLQDRYEKIRIKR